LNEVALHESVIKSDENEFEIGRDEVEVDKCDVIFQSLGSIIELDINMSELKDSFSPFVRFYKMVNR